MSVTNDLFAKQTDDFTRPSHAGPDAVPEAKAEAPRYRKMASTAEMEAVFRDIVGQAMPERVEDLIRTENRTKLQVVELPVNAYVGNVSKSHFAWTIMQLIDPANASTFVSTLHSMQPNGRWVPVQCDIRPGTARRLDGTRPSREALNKDEVQVHGDSTRKELLEPAYVTIDVMDARILWMDALGNTDVKRDFQGNVVSETSVTVKQGMDPALTDALRGQADAIGMLANTVLQDRADRLSTDVETAGTGGASSDEVEALKIQLAELRGEMRANAERPTVTIAHRNKGGRPRKDGTPSGTPRTDK